MKYLFFLFTLLVSIFAFGQTNQRDNLNSTDTCARIDKEASLNLVTKTRHSQPLYVANGIIIRGDLLLKDTSLIKSVSVLKCPASFNKFSYIAYNGAIIISTNQEIKTVTPTSIRKQKYPKIQRNVLFAINGDIISDSDLRISISSIKEIELVKKRPDNDEVQCINIWTLTKKERQPNAALCRGITIK